MSQSHIRLRNISLRFQLYANKSLSLRELVLNPFRTRALESNSFLAVDDVSLDVSHGERVALIGPNGAGKSSLLKIIAGIYPASSGVLEIQGRITPMIEMGAGFHQDLTGRENIYLNAAILGVPRADVEPMIPKILEFSEIPAHFLDVGIKYYSSGMVSRLAFSVAMELRPEILILDEIFAAGDAHFVEKATKRLQEFIASAHIMLLVTHDLKLARTLTKRGIWVQGGKVVKDGPIDEVGDAYVAAEEASKAKTQKV